MQVHVLLGKLFLAFNENDHWGMSTSVCDLLLVKPIHLPCVNIEQIHIYLDVKFI